MQAQWKAQQHAGVTFCTAERAGRRKRDRIVCATKQPVGGSRTAARMGGRAEEGAQAHTVPTRSHDGTNRHVKNGAAVLPVAAVRNKAPLSALSGPDAVVHKLNNGASARRVLIGTPVVKSGAVFDNGRSVTYQVIHEEETAQCVSGTYCVLANK